MPAAPAFVAFGDGQLGTQLQCYFGRAEWKTAEIIKEVCPAATTIAYVMTHGKSPGAIREFYSLNPHFDRFVFQRETAPRRDLLALRIPPRHSFEWPEHPKIYMTPAEFDFLQPYWVERRRLVVLSPYSGDANKSLDGTLSIGQFAEAAAGLSRRGWLVVVLGSRASGAPLPMLRPNPDIVDLRNLVGARVAIALCRMSSGYLGQSTSLLAASWSANVPNVFFWPEERRESNFNDILSGRIAPPRYDYEIQRLTGLWKYDAPYSRPVVKSKAEWPLVDIEEIIDLLDDARTKACYQNGFLKCQNGPLSAWSAAVQ